MRRERQVALVTGAATGFGRALAASLAHRGYDVVATARAPFGRNREAIQELVALAEPHASSVHVAEMDVTEDASVRRVIAAVLTERGRIDALVNSAGFGVFGPWESIPVDLVRSQLETNLLGAWRTARAVVPAMRERGSGTIVNVSSESGLRPMFWEAAYAASKSALEAMTAVMRYELMQFGIRVCLVNPGWYAGTSFDSKATWAWGDQRKLYEPLAAALEEGNSDDAPRVDPQEVAEAIGSLLDMPDPPLHTLVHCRPLRSRSSSDEEYEHDLFRYFGAAPFRTSSMSEHPVE